MNSPKQCTHFILSDLCACILHILTVISYLMSQKLNFLNNFSFLIYKTLNDKSQLSSIFDTINSLDYYLFVPI